jgi:hypothetical protein
MPTRFKKNSQKFGLIWKNKDWDSVYWKAMWKTVGGKN